MSTYVFRLTPISHRGHLTAGQVETRTQLISDDPRMEDDPMARVQVSPSLRPCGHAIIAI
jgi:hypothetical protein